MKTSIKLLLGALLFAVVLLVAGNAVASKEIKKIIKEQENVQEDSINNGQQTMKIQFKTRFKSRQGNE